MFRTTQNLLKGRATTLSSLVTKNVPQNYKYINNRSFSTHSYLQQQQQEPTTSEGIPYSKLTVGIPKEVHKNEQRVAQTPETVAALKKQGFRVIVEKSAGDNAKFFDQDFIKAGAEVKDREEVYKADIILKVRPPEATNDHHEADLLQNGKYCI
jgi:NAD(P) transhydrogenase